MSGPPPNPGGARPNTGEPWPNPGGAPPKPDGRPNPCGQAPDTVANEPPWGDRASWFLAMAVTRMPAGRAEWGQAMLAELDQIREGRDRWRFVLGAARTALIPPRSGRLAAIILATAAIAAAIAIHVLVSGVGVTATVVVPGLPALCAWAALRERRQARPVSRAGRAAQVIAVALIAACPVIALRLIALYPGQAGAGHIPWAGALTTVIFAAELGAFLWLVLWRPGPMGAGRRSGLLGVGAALVTGGVFWLNQPSGGASDNVVVNAAVVLTAIAAPLAAGVLAALPGLVRRDGIGRWLRRGAGEVLWGALLTGPVAFIVVLLTTSNSAIAAEATDPVFINEANQQGATSILAWIARDDLGGAIVFLTGVCLLAGFVFLLILPVSGPAEAGR